MPTPFESGVRAWNVCKKAPHQGVIVDFKQRIFSYDGNRYWVRFETQDKLYIYSIIEGSQA